MDGWTGGRAMGQGASEPSLVPAQNSAEPRDGEQKHQMEEETGEEEVTGDAAPQAREEGEGAVHVGEEETLLSAKVELETKQGEYMRVDGDGLDFILCVNGKGGKADFFFVVKPFCTT